MSDETTRERWAPDAQAGRLSVFLVALLVAASTAPAAEAPPPLSGELQGKVVEVSGGELRLSVPGRYVPRAGDPAVIYRPLDAHQLRLIARAVVRESEGDLVTATPSGGELPRADDVVVVTTSLPPGVIQKVGFKVMPLGTESGAGTGGVLLTDASLAGIDAMKRRAEAEAEAAAAWREARDAVAKGDRRGATEAFRRAAALNVPEACMALTRLLAESSGDTDRQESRAQLRRAAELGVAEAQLAVGDAYAATRGTRGQELADAWYRKAAESGSGAARDKLKRVRD
jgi:TPR repeat protein